MSIRDAIADLGVKVKQGKKEDEQDYLKRIFAALSEEFSDDPKDKKWKAFGTKAQEWYNAASEAADNEDDLPHFEADEEDESEADEDEAPKAKKAKGNGKAKGKRAKAADEDEGDEDEAPKGKKGKAKKGKAVSGKAKKGNGASRRSPPAYEDDQVIKVIEKKPHNAGTKIAERYAKLKTGMTVAAARKAGLSMLDLKCDVNRGNISIK